MATSKTTKTHTIAKFTGHSGTRRILTKANQDDIIGVKGVATQDLIWEPGNKKVDVTDVNEEVIAALKADGNFTFRTVEVPVADDSAANPSA